MKKHSDHIGPIKDKSLNKYYILTRPTRLSELSLDELADDQPESGWRDKSRQMQARRWRKIRHQLA